MAKTSYILLYSILLGVVISSISYFGFEYFLEKRPMKECNSLNECVIKDMPIPVNENIQKENKKNISLSTINTNDSLNFQLDNLKCHGLTPKISLIKMAIIFILILIIVYFIYYFIYI